MLEADTRLISYAQWEIDWAHERQPQQRTPVPAVGDEVLYRHNGWGPVARADVLSVQSETDLDDPHLWRVETDGFGQPVLLDGRPVMQQRFDPWPLVQLRVPGLAQRVETREARLRGSAGWLPLDWELRFRPLPGSIIIARG